MSKSAIEGLKPEILWQRFYEISQVPRPSKKEEKIRTHLRDVLEELNLEYKEDKVGILVFSNGESDHVQRGGLIYQYIRADAEQYR